MNAEKKREFTLRITQANRTELIVILYDMILCYIEEAKNCAQTGDNQGFIKEVRSAENCVRELISSLDFKYDISLELLALYGYVSRIFNKIIIRKNPEQLESAASVIKKLRGSFQQIAAQDTSEALMKNTQAVYAGLTYGRGTLKENYDSQSNSRGFLA